MIAFRMSRRADMARHSANVRSRKMKILLIHEFFILYFDFLVKLNSYLKRIDPCDAEKLELYDTSHNISKLDSFQVFVKDCVRITRVKLKKLCYRTNGARAYAIELWTHQGDLRST